MNFHHKAAAIRTFKCHNIILKCSEICLDVIAECCELIAKWTFCHQDLNKSISPIDSNRSNQLVLYARGVLTTPQSVS